MFILKRVCSRYVISERFLSTKRDPGISKRKKVLQETSDEIESTDIDDLESDFMSVHKSYGEHLREVEALKEKEKYLIVRQKYFKETFPNFLTWHDKEQIRYLHNNYPEEWTVEKLAEGFPALPDIIEKIIKGKWMKKDQQKILNHDKAALKNWNSFKRGKLNDLPQNLKEHLQKFSDRSLNFKPFQKSDHKEVIVLDENKNQHASGEFSEIISSYQKLKDVDKKKEISQNNLQYENSYENRFKEKKDHTLMTFKELQGSVERSLSSGKEISLQDKLLKEASLPKQGGATVELSKKDISNIIESKHETKSNEIGILRKTNKDMSHLIYPENISIPKKLYKSGYTYKLNDCYYDSDGEFLYRVPGMG